MRIKGLHVVNEASIFGTIFAIVKPFLKEKTVKRVCITQVMSFVLTSLFVCEGCTVLHRGRTNFFF